MKKIINYSILAFTLLIFGCQDNFLDEPTSSIIDPETLLTSKTGAEAVSYTHLTLPTIPQV